MIRNYLTIAWRNLAKHKLFSAINIFGLASGMAVCLLALMNVKGAYKYDTHHPGADRSYRIITALTRKNGERLLAASSPLALGAYLKNNFNAIENCTRVYFSSGEIRANGKSLYAKQAYADADFYKIFDFQVMVGSPATAPQTVVLSSETAERFFGKTNPIGEIFTLGQSGDFIVTGVLAKSTHPSHLRFDLLASMPVATTGKPLDDWADEAAGYTYVKLRKGMDALTLEKILSRATAEANRLIAPVTNKKLVFEPQALKAISPAVKQMYNSTDEPTFPGLAAFAGVGLGILVLAFFNYVNLTLARSLDRAREVGIRKVVGALRHQLVRQFLSESVLVAMLAFGLAHLLLKAIRTLPTVQHLIGDVSQDGTLWLLFILFTLATGLLAGWIPARVLSSFEPVRVLKGRFNARLLGGVGLRKTLTVIQFALSLIALVGLQVFYQQAMYMATADYGFNRERILNIPVQPASYHRAATAFLSTTGVEQVSGTSEEFGFFGGDTRFMQRQRQKEADSISAAYFSVTPSFIERMGLRFIAGENLPVTNTATTSAFVVLNEEACRQLQFKSPLESIGKQLWINDSTPYTVAGVVQDFHFASFRRSIRPLMLVYNPAEFKVISLTIASGAEPRILPRLQAVWKNLYPNQPFEGVWFDEQLYQRHLHKDDLLFVGLLTGMALTIACLGLLGMVVCTTGNRRKEVSIRRVMGATAWQIVAVISKEFVALLLVAVCIGLPVGYFVGDLLLAQYAYRIPVSIGILAGSAAALLGLGGITIGWQTFRTALANPVKSLRSE